MIVVTEYDREHGKLCLLGDKEGVGAVFRVVMVKGREEDGRFMIDFMAFREMVSDELVGQAMVRKGCFEQNNSVPDDEFCYKKGGCR